jgi:hypothetical protein
VFQIVKVGDLERVYNLFQSINFDADFMMEIFREESYKNGKLYFLLTAYRFKNMHFKFIVSQQIILDRLSHEIHCRKSDLQHPRGHPLNQNIQSFLPLFFNLVA